MLRIALATLFLATPAVAFAQAAPQAAPATMAKPAKQFEIIDPASVEPTRLLPTPPAAGSPAEALELVQLHQLIKGTSAARMEQAKWDDEHEDPAIFDNVIGTSLKALPATWSLLLTIQNDSGIAGNLAKKHFGRIRPWGADATLPNCDAGKGKKPLGSYPSGHSVLGFSVGYALAQLVPAKSQAILDRAADYALSREICGVHFRSDAGASQVIGTYVAANILADPRMQSRVAAARTELGKFASR
jgi:acid phosphatase (class A)